MPDFGTILFCIINAINDTINLVSLIKKIVNKHIWMNKWLLFKKINFIPDKHNIANHTLERLRVEDSNRPNGTLHYTFRTQPYHPNLNKKIYI